MSGPARRAAAVAVLLAAALALGGCGGGSVAPPPPGPPTAQLRIGMIDYRFQLSAAVLRPGEVTVVATNAGSAPHDVVLSQGGHVLGGSRVLDPGARQTFTVRVAPRERVSLECTVAGHAAMGMTATVSVADGSAGDG